MALRVAFSVSVFLEPDILIVDEALAVGDAPFQAKCFRKIKELQSRGTSLLFTSHDMAAVRALCSRAVWLDQGEVRSQGAVEDIVREYELMCWEQQGIRVKGDDPGASALSSHRSEAELTSRQSNFACPKYLLEENTAFKKLSEIHRFGIGSLRVLNAQLTDDDDQPQTLFEYSQECRIHLLLDAIRTSIDWRPNKESQRHRHPDPGPGRARGNGTDRFWPVAVRIESLSCHTRRREISRDGRHLWIQRWRCIRIWLLRFQSGDRLRFYRGGCRFRSDSNQRWSCRSCAFGSEIPAGQAGQSCSYRNPVAGSSATRAARLSPSEKSLFGAVHCSQERGNIARALAPCISGSGSSNRFDSLKNDARYNASAEAVLHDLNTQRPNTKTAMLNP
jgi:hypothetical protein